MAITPGTDYDEFPIPTADAATNASEIRSAIGAAPLDVVTNTAVNTAIATNPEATRAAAGAVASSSLSTNGGAGNVPQYDSAGNLTTGPFANAGNTFGDPGNIQIPDLQGLIWLKKDGTRSGARIRHWQDHNPHGGELIIDSPWKLAFIPTGPIQVGANDSARFIRKVHLVSGAATNNNPALNFMPSGALAFQTCAWDGTRSNYNEIIAQAHALDTSGANSVLRFWDQASVNGETVQQSIWTPGRGDVSGNLIAEVYKDGIWSRGTAPTFQTLTDEPSITYTCSKFKSSQNAEVMLTGNRILVISEVEDGMRGVIFVVQDGSGSRTLTPSGGSALDLSTAANACDRVAWEYDGQFLIFSVTKNVQRELASLDADASAFIAAASITNVTQKLAVNTLVSSLKSASLWAKFYGIYPFVGGTPTAHAKDLKAAYDITWAGGITHDANGITGNGTTGVGTTGINLSALGAINSASGYAYCRTQSPTSGGHFFGAIESGNRFGLRVSPPNIFAHGPNNAEQGMGVGVSSNFRGHFAINRSGATSSQLYANAIVSADTAASIAAPNLPIQVLAWNATSGAGAFSNANLAFAAFGQSLSANEWTTFRGIVDTFQTALGRANP
jgi:hypothetical protein